MPFYCGKSHTTRFRRVWDGERQERPAVRPHEEIATLAYSYWEARGRQGGSAEDDWYRAEREWDVRHGR